MATNRFTVVQTVAHDYQSFYSGDRLVRLGVGFGAGAVLANTTADRQVQHWYQSNVRSSASDNVSEIAKQFGEGRIMIPLSLLAAGVTYLEPDSAVGHWGVYTTRSYLTGAPAMLLMQVVTGGSRPEETDHDSAWRPFEDNNGVSGHSFMGAVPFIALARMNDDHPVVKYLAYAASTAAAWSRVNDDAHYLSQIALGWYMAWESVDAVSDSNEKDRKFSFSPYVDTDSYGLALNVVW